MLTPLLDQLLLDSQILLLTRILQNVMQTIRQNNVDLIMTFEILFGQPTFLHSILRKKTLKTFFVWPKLDTGASSRNFFILKIPLDKFSHRLSFTINLEMLYAIPPYCDFQPLHHKIVFHFHKKEDKSEVIFNLKNNPTLDA